jgi:ABC-2 type transport system permease protein
MIVQQRGLFFVSVILAVVAFISFGLVIAPIFVLNPGVSACQNAMEFPVCILCDFLFPIAMLPRWTTPISWLLPPYWAAVALHGTSTGGAHSNQTFSAWGMLLLFSIIDLVIASRCSSTCSTRSVPMRHWDWNNE